MNGRPAENCSIPAGFCACGSASADVMDHMNFPWREPHDLNHRVARKLRDGDNGVSHTQRPVVVKEPLFGLLGRKEMGEEAFLHVVERQH